MAPSASLTIEHMAIQRMDHVGIVELGLVLHGTGPWKVAGWTASWGSRAYGQTLQNAVVGGHRMLQCKS
jgi:hypothetical protein